MYPFQHKGQYGKPNNTFYHSNLFLHLLGIQYFAIPKYLINLFLILPIYQNFPQ